MKPVIEKLQNNDTEKFAGLVGVFEEVFEMKGFQMPGNTYLTGLLNRSSFLVFVAMDDDKVIAGLTAYELPSYYIESSYMYIYDLAVQVSFQRQGIGRALVAAIIQHCRDTGIKEVFVQADLEDDYALDFYRATGGKEEPVVHFTYPING